MPSDLRVVTTRPFLDGDLTYIRDALPTVRIDSPRGFDRESLVEAVLEGVDALLGPPPPVEVLRAALPRLRLVQIPWTGVDQVQLSDCHALRIPCANSHTNSTAVAEMALALLLAALKQIPAHDRDLRRGKWHRPGSEEGFDPPLRLTGKSIGFFGYGPINQDLCGMLRGFPGRRLACVRTARPIAGVDEVYATADLARFLAACDVVIVAAPLTRETSQVFDERAFESMRGDAVFVNIARGGLVTERALYEALAAKRIGAAALDAWYAYPGPGGSDQLPSRYPFGDLDNVVMSPHRAGFLRGELPHLDGAVDNLGRLARDETIQNLINPLKEY